MGCCKLSLGPGPRWEPHHLAKTPLAQSLGFANLDPVQNPVQGLLPEAMSGPRPPGPSIQGSSRLPHPTPLFHLPPAPKWTRAQFELSHCFWKGHELPPGALSLSQCVPPGPLPSVHSLQLCAAPLQRLAQPPPASPAPPSTLWPPTLPSVPLAPSLGAWTFLAGSGSRHSAPITPIQSSAHT